MEVHAAIRVTWSTIMVLEPPRTTAQGSGRLVSHIGTLDDPDRPRGHADDEQRPAVPTPLTPLGEERSTAGAQTHA